MITMSSNQHRGAVKAFTLIELLVVVSLIAVLLSILLPALSMAKEAARRTQCASNVRQFGLAFLLYAQETGVFPIYNWTNRFDARSDAWAPKLSPYLQINYKRHVTATSNGNIIEAGPAPDPIWFCPSDYENNPIGYVPNYPNIVSYEDGRETAENFSRDPWRMEQITRPSGIIAMIEGLRPFRLVVYCFPAFPPTLDSDGDGHKDTNLTILGAIGAKYNNVGARHDRRANQVYLDGHVELRHIRDLAANKDDVWGRDLFQGKLYKVYP